MSVYPVFLDGWDQHSIWGWDSSIPSYYAQLTRNGNSDDNGPDIWITPPVYPQMMLPETLAAAIAAATGADLNTVQTAMNESLDDGEGRIHRILNAGH